MFAQVYIPHDWESVQQSYIERIQSTREYFPLLTRALDIPIPSSRTSPRYCSIQWGRNALYEELCWNESCVPEIIFSHGPVLHRGTREKAVSSQQGERIPGKCKEASEWYGRTNLSVSLHSCPTLCAAEEIKMISRLSVLAFLQQPWRGSLLPSHTVK